MTFLAAARNNIGSNARKAIINTIHDAICQRLRVLAIQSRPLSNRAKQQQRWMSQQPPMHQQQQTTFKQQPSPQTAPARPQPMSDPLDYSESNTESWHSDFGLSSESESQHRSNRNTAATAGIATKATDAIHHSRDLANYLRKQMQTNWYRTVGVVFATLGSIAFAMTVFREQVKDETATQIADVAQRSLGSDTVTQQVNQLSQDVVRKLLADETVRREAIALVQQFLATPATKDLMVQLAKHVLADPQTQAQVAILGKDLVSRLAADAHVNDLMVRLLQRSINHPTNIAALGKMVRNVVQEDFTKETLLLSVKAAAHNTLQDEAVQQRATEMMKRIMNDPLLQQSGGDAVWQTLRAAVGFSVLPPVKKTPSYAEMHPITMATNITNSNGNNKNVEVCALVPKAADAATSSTPQTISAQAKVPGTASSTTASPSVLVTTSSASAAQQVNDINDQAASQEMLRRFGSS